MNLPGTVFNNGHDFSVGLLLSMTIINISLNWTSPSIPAFEGGKWGGYRLGLRALQFCNALLPPPVSWRHIDCSSILESHDSVRLCGLCHHYRWNLYSNSTFLPSEDLVTGYYWEITCPHDLLLQPPLENSCIRPFMDSTWGTARCPLSGATPPKFLG